MPHSRESLSGGRSGRVEMLDRTSDIGQPLQSPLDVLKRNTALTNPIYMRGGGGSDYGSGSKTKGKLTRRRLLQLAGLSLVAAACSIGAPTVPTRPAATSTASGDGDPTPNPEPTKTPEMRIASILDVFPAFKNDPEPNNSDYVLSSDIDPVLLRRRKDGDRHFVFGEANDPVDVNITQAGANIDFIFGGHLQVTGMVNVLDPNDTLTQQYLNQAVNQPPDRVMSFAGGNESVPARGYSMIWRTQDEKWLAVPWCTPKDTVAEASINGGQPFVSYFTKNGDQKGAFIAKIPLKDLVVEFDDERLIGVDPDGRYFLNGSKYHDYLRQKGVDNAVIQLYERLFTPRISAERWAQRPNEVQMMEKSRQMFYPPSQLMVDMACGTFRLAIQPDESLGADVQQIAVAVENDPNFYTQFFSVRSQIDVSVRSRRIELAFPFDYRSCYGVVKKDARTGLYRISQLFVMGEGQSYRIKVNEKGVIKETPDVPAPPELYNRPIVLEIGSSIINDLPDPTKGTITEFDQNPIGNPPGENFPVVFHGQIASAVNNNEGYNGSDRHRAYLPDANIPGQIWPNGIQKPPPFQMENWVYINSIDQRIGKNLALDGQNIFAMGGDFTGHPASSNENPYAYANTILYRNPDNDELYLLPMSFHRPPGQNWEDVEFGKLMNDIAPIKLHEWNKLQFIVTRDGLWTVVNGVVTGYVPNRSPDLLTQWPNFGPYADVAVSNIDTYQAGHKIVFFSDQG